MSDESHRLDPKSKRAGYKSLDWAKERFREVPDGRYTPLEMHESSIDLVLAASTIASHFGMELKLSPIRTLFRGKRGDTVLTRRLASESGPFVNYSTRFVFVVKEGEVVDLSEDQSTEL